MIKGEDSMKKNIFNIIAIMLLVFIIIYLPLKIVYYDEKINEADNEYEQSHPENNPVNGTYDELITGDENFNI